MSALTYDEAMKTPARETDKAIYFFSHTVGEPYDCFSQWAEAPFVDPAMDNARFPTAEHYMMAMKARIMRDFESYDRIMEASTPAEAKALGRQVKNYKSGLWSASGEKVVERANWLKFSQNTDLMDILLSTGDKLLVESSPEDRIWGIGLDVNAAEGREFEWGENKMGKALMRVRECIRSGETEQGWPRTVTVEGCTSCGSCGQSHAPHDLMGRVQG